MLTPAESYDYALISQGKALFNDFENKFPDYVVFKNIFNKLLSIYDVTPTGFTPATISLLGNDSEIQKFIKRLKSQAAGYLELPVPNISLKALKPMYAACFGHGSDFYECMRIVSEDRVDDLEFVDTVLSDYCSERNGIFVIDDNKIQEKLDVVWNEINKKKFKLEYDARTQTVRHFRQRLELMKSWTVFHSEHTKKGEKLLRLKLLRNEILKYVSELETNDKWKGNFCANIMSFLLCRMKAALVNNNDTWLFSNILLTGIISMDKNRRPILNEVFTDIRFNEPWRYVIRHIEAQERSIEEIKAEILGSIGDDSGLLDNLNQLKMLGIWLGNHEEEYQVSEQQIKEAKESAELKYMRFLDKLELAYTYNQINETEKETIAGIAEQYKSYFFEIQDFACWRRFLEGLEKQIEQYAQKRHETLRNELSSRKEKAPGSSLLAATSKLLEVDRNFSVAEEYINRFDNGETEITEEMEAVLHDVDYFDEFISPKVFGPLFNLCKANSGSALRNFGWSYLEKRLPKDWTARQRKDSEGLISSWIVRKNQTTSSDIQKLLTYLGFDVKMQSKQVATRKRYSGSQFHLPPEVRRTICIQLQLLGHNSSLLLMS